MMMWANREEGEEHPRKVPRLDLLAAAAVAADPGRAVRDEGEVIDVDSGPLVLSNLREEGAKGIKDNKRCDHFPTDSTRLKMLSSSVFSERAGKCEHCKRPFEGTSILMCLECGRHFCSGVGSIEHPFGHSRVHAEEEEHWVAVLFENPESAFCFKCDCVLDGPRDIVTGLFAAAEVDSGSDEEASPESKDSDFPEPCNHVPTDDAHMEMLRLSLESEYAGNCVHCNTFKDSSILVCMECGRHLCAGLGSGDCPSGHSRLHAKQKQHWVAALYDEPSSAYCFKCEYVVCVTDAADDLEIDGIEAGYHTLELSDEARNTIRGLSNAFGSAYVHDYAIRGMPNLGNTCYLNAMLQCLLVLDKLRAGMLGPDAPQGPLATTLQKLFVEASTAGGMLDPQKFLSYMGRYDQRFNRNDMEDSHELLVSLRNILGEVEGKKGQNAGTVIDSAFRFEMSETGTCRCSLTHSFPPSIHYELSMALPSKVHPAKSAASSQTSGNSKSQPTIGIQLCPAKEQSKTGESETVVESGDSHSHCSELKDVVVEQAPEPLEVDSTEVKNVCQSEDAVQGSLQALEDKASPELSQGVVEVPVKSHGVFEDMNETTADSIASIEDCLSLFSENMIDWRCDNCKVREKLNTDRSKNGGKKLASTIEDTTVGGELTEESDGTICQNEQSSGLNTLSVESKSSSRHAQGPIIQTGEKTVEGTNLGMSCGYKDSAACNTPRAPKCHAIRAEKLTDLWRAKRNNDINIQIKMREELRKKIDLDRRTCQLKRDEQRDRNGNAIKTCRFNKLPQVLTLHLKRFDNFQKKISGHIRYKEYLDLVPFMDPSSADKDHSRYRLVGVVEHRGTSVKIGHVVAYVRARKLGNPQKQGSCSHSWFCANDTTISEVSLEDVLKREAYILLYERLVEG